MSSNPFERWTPTPPPPSKPELRVEKLEEPTLEMASASRGKENRVKNEDTAYIDPERGIFFVADGLGGSAQGGDLASKAVVEPVLKGTIEKEKNESLLATFGGTPALASARGGAPAPAGARGGGEESLDRATVEDAVRVLIGQRMRSRVDRFHGGSDTTISFGKFWHDKQGNEKLTIASVGDSRIYRFREGALERLTDDSSIVQILVDLNVPDTDGFPIVDDQDVTRAVSLETLKVYGKKNRDLLRMIPYAEQLAEKEQREVKSFTIDEIRHFVLDTVLHHDRIDARTVDVEDGDLYLAFSDGIHDNLTDEEIAEVVREHYPDTERIADALVKAAVARSVDTKHPRHKPDDMTASVTMKRKRKNEKQTA